MIVSITSDNMWIDLLELWMNHLKQLKLQACDKFFIKENEQLVTILWQSLSKLATGHSTTVCKL